MKKIVCASDRVSSAPLFLSFPARKAGLLRDNIIISLLLEINKFSLYFILQKYSIIFDKLYGILIK
jgi:hypothetical protein